jgi:leucyl/phenylalanyl-tRNA---protein transferase
VPVEPPPSQFAFVVEGVPPGEEFAGVGADLEPGTLLAAYRCGLFPMPAGRRQAIGWWSPDPRGIVPLDGLRVSRSLRASVRRFDIRIDTAFDDVIAACADPNRADGWISPRIQQAYLEMHRLGWAHSVEAWREDRLVGGLYGLAIGGLFAGESMFHHESDASKVALVALVDELRADSDDRRLLDTQWRTPHLESLGGIAIPRTDYLARLAAALEAPLPAVFC